MKTAIIHFAIIICLFGAAAFSTAADSITLKFQGKPMKMESLSNPPTILLAMHAAALYYEIDFQWDPVQERMTLSKYGTEVSLVLGNRHALVTTAETQASPVLRPLWKPPIILRGVVVLSPQDMAILLGDLLPSMDVLWDEKESIIEVKSGSPAAKRSANGFELKTIVIDPGHGGRDPGTSKSGIKEKKVVLDISLKLAKLIEAKSNWRAILTRKSDKFIKLQRRTEIAAQYPADNTIFISIHCNSDPTSLGRGLESYVFDTKASDAAAAALAKRENAEEEMDLTYILNHCYHVGNEPYSLEAARKIQSSLVKKLKLKDRGIRRAPFYVLAGTKMPAVLIELGFISNLYDRKKLQSESFQQSAAEALFDAIKEFDRATVKSIAKAD